MENEQVDPSKQEPSHVRILASPLARRIAERAKIDLTQIRGTGPGGRIVLADVEAYIANLKAARSATSQPIKKTVDSSPVVAPPLSETPKQEVKAEPKTEMFKVEIVREDKPAVRIPDILLEKRETTPPVFRATDVATKIDPSPVVVASKDKTFFVPPAPEKTPVPSAKQVIHMAADCSLIEFYKLQNAINEQRGVKLQVADAFVRASALALKKLGLCGASETKGVSLSLLVDHEKNTVVQTLHQADAIVMADLSALMRRLISDVHAGRVKENNTKAAFAVSDMTGKDIDSFSFSSSAPFAAVLCLGSPKDVPVIHEGRIEIGKALKCSLVFDSAEMTASSGAAFLSALKQYIEQPYLLAV